MSGDWVKLHRRSLESQVFSDPALWHLFCWCLLRTNWKDGWFEGVKIPPGSFATGRDAAASQLGLSSSAWYRGIKKLEKIGVISLKANNRFTVISIVKWSFFQNSEQRMNNERTTDEQQADSQRTTDEQPADTIEEGKDNKEGKKVKKERTILSPASQAVVDRWNESGATVKVRRVFGTRAKRLSDRLVDSDWPWAEAIAKLPIPNTPKFDWQPDFDWLIANDRNAYSLAEGKYDRKHATNGQGPGVNYDPNHDYESEAF